MELRPYQIPIFNDNTTGILGLHWARQLGKSTVLAAWAVDRLLTRPGRLVTVLSNCQQNGAEFAEKCQAICAEHGAIFEAESRSVELDLPATEIRIKVLAANPRSSGLFLSLRVPLPVLAVFALNPQPKSCPKNIQANSPASTSPKPHPESTAST